MARSVGKHEAPPKKEEVLQEQDYDWTPSHEAEPKPKKEKKAKKERRSHLREEENFDSEVIDHESDLEWEAGWEPESDEELLSVMGELELLDPSWEEILAGARLAAGECLESRFLEACGERIRPWFTKLACYFLFRYSIDAWFEGTDGENERRLRKRSLRTIFLLCMLRYEKTGTLTREDLADIVHLFSRETEHSEENLRILREP